MPILNNNSTNYEHPWEPNLADLHTAMTYNGSGEPVLRTHVDGITLEGNVIVDKVKLWDGTNTLQFEQPNNDNEAGQPSMPAESYNMVFNGTTWDRMRGNTSTGVLVNLSNALIPVTGTVSVLDGKILVSNFTSTVNVASLPAITGTVTVSNFTSTVYQGTVPWAITGTVTTIPSSTVPTYVMYADSTNMQMDATDRLRVSQAYDAWWYAPTVDKDGDYRYIESYTGTNAGSVFVQNLASLALSSGTDNNGSITRISRRRHKMRPTISVRVSLSLNWNGYDANVRKRAGLFTNFNGTFFQVQDDLSIVCRRRLANGTLVEKVVPRTSFNVDKLDGTTSRYNLSPTAPHTFSTGITGFVSTTPDAIDGGTIVYNTVLTVSDRSKFFPGLKGRITGISPSTFNQIVMVESVTGSVGPGNITVTYLNDPGAFSSLSNAQFTHDYMFHQLVFGFDFNGNRNTRIRFFVNGMFGRQVIHMEDFGDTLSTPWSNAPAISTRFEVTNLNSPGYRPSLLVSSETVTVEGPPNENRAFGTAYNNTPITYTKTLTQEFPIIGIALRTGEPYQRADLQAMSFQIQDIANINPQNSGVMFWRLLLNPSISGTLPVTTNIGRASRAWAYTSANSVSGGIELSSGYITQASVTALPTDKDFVNLGSNIAYDDSDKLVLVVKMLAGGSADSKLVAQMNFIEYL